MAECFLLKLNVMLVSLFHHFCFLFQKVLFSRTSGVVTLAAGDNVVIDLPLLVSGSATYSWTNPLDEVILAGQTRATLTINSVARKDQGMYTCNAEVKPVAAADEVWQMVATRTIGKCMYTYTQ